MMNFFFGILCFIFGNIISFLDKRKKNTIDFILKPNRKNIWKGNPKLIFSLSRILEMFPNRIPLAFNCYQKALTGRYILNLFRIKNSLTIGFNRWIQVINATPAELFNFSAKTSLGVLNPNLFLGRLFKI
jgi:hypothetical protein